MFVNFVTDYTQFLITKLIKNEMIIFHAIHLAQNFGNALSNELDAESK